MSQVSHSKDASKTKTMSIMMANAKSGSMALVKISWHCQQKQSWDAFPVATQTLKLNKSKLVKSKNMTKQNTLPLSKSIRINNRMTSSSKKICGMASASNWSLKCKNMIRTTIYLTQVATSAKITQVSTTVVKFKKVFNKKITHNQLQIIVTSHLKN